MTGSQETTRNNSSFYDALGFEFGVDLGFGIGVIWEQEWFEFESGFGYVYNCIFDIVMFITLVRYIFLLKYTFLAQFQIGKFILIFLSIPLGFYLIQEFFAFHDFVDSEGTEGFQSNTHFLN